MRVCRSLRYVGGEETEAFEAAFARYLGVKYVVGVANGTDALELALVAAGLQPGDEVLVPANTFIATAEAVHAAGGVARFVDVHPDSGLIDLDHAASRLTPATRAIMPVHLYGRMVDMEAVMTFAELHGGLIVVEDAAQAHGARRGEHVAGAVGHAGCFSFYPGKNLGAVGDAGATITNDAGIAQRLRLLRDHGRQGDGHAVIGRNSRLDPLQAAVLSVKLEHLDRWTKARRASATALRERLDDVVLNWWGDGHPGAEVHHLFPILVPDRDGLRDALQRHGVQTGVHYREDLPRTAAFADQDGSCPVAADRAHRQLSLPMHPHLNEAAIDRIATSVNAALAP